MYSPSPEILWPSACNVPKCVYCSANPATKPFSFSDCKLPAEKIEQLSHATAPGAFATNKTVRPKIFFFIFKINVARRRAGATNLVETFLTHASPARTRSRLNQAKLLRGGGTEGRGRKDAAEIFAGEKKRTGAGEIKIKLLASGGNSSFNVAAVNAVFCSAFFPVEIAWHNAQGCSPSKVWQTAAVKDS